MVEKKSLWNEAGTAGLVLGGISVVYALISLLLQKFADANKFMQICAGALAFILWAVKFGACIYILKLLMKKFVAAYPSADNRDSFNFGVATALLSALVYAAYTLAQYLFITPDIFKETLDMIMETSGSMFTADQLDQLEQMGPKLPVYSFFVTLVYCFLFGVVLSAIFSKNIPPRNPFKRDNSTDEQ